MAKKIIFGGLAVLFGAGIFFFPPGVSRQHLITKYFEKIAGNKNQVELAPAATVHGIYPSDLTDDRNLVGASQNVFVAKVIKQAGNSEGGGIPTTLFDVDVVLNIKGNLHGAVVVEQLGGYKDGVLYLVSGDGIIASNKNKEGNNYFLRPGTTYLFATRHIEKASYTLISHTSAIKIISNNASLTNEELGVLAENNERVRQLQIAYPNEILDVSDLNANRIQNSYRSLPPESRPDQLAPIITTPAPTPTPQPPAPLPPPSSSTSTASSSQ